VIEMLHRRQGTTVAAIMKATGWQPHSVRGFFAGVVRHKLGLTLVSEKTGEEHSIRSAVCDRPGLRQEGALGCGSQSLQTPQTQDQAQ
jgi:hypothetical protein